MTQYRIYVTDPALHDLQGIADYIANGLREPQTALRQIQRIREEIESLAGFPTRHPVVVDEPLAAKGYRIMTVNHYLIFYVVSHTEESVTVVRILYHRRDWMSILSNN